MAEYTLKELKQISSLEFRAVPTGNSYISRNGRRVQETKGTEYVPTSLGRIEVSEWTRLTKEAVLREKGADLLRAVCDHCRKHCAWLKTEKAIEDYAVSCISSEAYLHWDGWKEGEKEDEG